VTEKDWRIGTMVVLAVLVLALSWLALRKHVGPALAEDRKPLLPPHLVFLSAVQQQYTYSLP
jgi:uncharacterized membrane protein